MVDNVEVVIAAEGMPGPSPASLNVRVTVTSPRRSHVARLRLSSWDRNTRYIHDHFDSTSYTVSGQNQILYTARPHTEDGAKPRTNFLRIYETLGRIGVIQRSMLLPKPNCEIRESLLLFNTPW